MYHVYKACRYTPCQYPKVDTVPFVICICICIYTVHVYDFAYVYVSINISAYLYVKKHVYIYIYPGILSSFSYAHIFRNICIYIYVHVNDVITYTCRHRPRRSPNLRATGGESQWPCAAALPCRVLTEITWKP